MSNRNRHMMKVTREPDLFWITIEFDKHASKEALSSLIKSIKQMGLQCKFRTDMKESSFIEVKCNESQQKAIDKLIRSSSAFKVGNLNVADFDVDQDLLDKATEEREYSLPEDTHALSIYSAATGMKEAFENFPSLARPNKLLERASKICVSTLEVNSRLTNDIKLFRGTFIPSYVTGYRVGAQQIIHMDPTSRKEITGNISTVNSMGKGSLTIAKFEELIKHQMQEVGATKVSDLFQE